MNKRKITEEQVKGFYDHLVAEEKSTATVEKYLRDVRAFMRYTEEKEVSKEIVITYKRDLQYRHHSNLYHEYRERASQNYGKTPLDIVKRQKMFIFLAQI